MKRPVTIEAVERWLFTALCFGVCLWAVRMAFGVVRLAHYQGPMYLLGLLEVAVFFGAGVLPLIATRRSPRGTTLAWIGAILCLGYVTLLSLNMLRLGMYFPGLLRLLLWAAIATLMFRARRLQRNGPERLSGPI